MKKVIYATDYSEPSQCSLHFATSLARDCRAVLLVVHVSEVECSPVGELFDEDPEPTAEELKRLEAFEHRLVCRPPRTFTRRTRSSNLQTGRRACHRHRHTRSDWFEPPLGWQRGRIRDAAGTMPRGNDQEAESLAGTGVFREAERHGGCMCETHCTAWLHECNVGYAQG